MAAHKLAPEDVVVFYWGFSPWANKVISYLALRNMPHAQCDQPITLPRPDIKALGVNYRRVPVIAIGRDIFCDTLLIMNRLDTLFPNSNKYPTIAATDSTGRALEKLLEKWTDVGVFKSAADAIPSSLPLCQDPAFIKDRTELWGYDWTPAEQDKRRTQGLSNLRANFDFLEDLLADGRQWVLGTDKPQVADIHGEHHLRPTLHPTTFCHADDTPFAAAWIFGWMRSLPDGLPEQFFPHTRYAKTHAWLDRYDAAVQSSKDAGPKPQTLSSDDTLDKVLGKKDAGRTGGFGVPDIGVQDDPLGLKQGDSVEVYARDTGFNHRDVGKLVGLDNGEVVIEKASGRDGEPVRLHFPRWNFCIAPAKKSESNGTS